MMRSKARTMFFVPAVSLAMFAGCSDSNGPVTSSSADVALSTETVITQDLAQLSSVSIPGSPTYGVFSIGWNQFVGPTIQNAGTIGKAFAVVHDSLPLPGFHEASIDVGAITLNYTGGSAELVQKVTPRGDVLYSTFDKGLRSPATLPVNVPFVPGGAYAFVVGGAGSFTPASFQITAPASLLEVLSHSDGDLADLTSDLTITWTGGASDDSVLVRLVPHLRPQQMNGRGPGGPPNGGGMPGGRGSGGPRPGGPGPNPGVGPQPGTGGPMGPLNGLGSAASKGIVRKVANTGTASFTPAELQDVVSSTGADEIMVGVSQINEDVVVHDGKTYTLLLRNGDRVVLRID